MEARKNVSLWVAIALPIALILLVAVSIYLPRFFAKPQYNFVYALGVGYGDSYTVLGNKLVENTSTMAVAPGAIPPPASQLYLYNVSQNQSQEISFANAEALSFYPYAQSQDGFTVVQGGGDGGMFPFYSSGENYNDYYLTGHGLSKQLNIPNQTGLAPYNQFIFLGWVNN
jgi:hypothetical protein